jgi:hypothetical protein
LKAVTTLKWLLEQGVDLNIEDGARVLPKFAASRYKAICPDTWAAVAQVRSNGGGNATTAKSQR